MSSEDIKSGSEVVSEFLDSLHGDEAIDADTLTAVHELFKTGKLSRTRLLRALEKLRASDIAQRNHAAFEGKARGND